jgi:hypothetical protein|tara:strand:+ start:14225 stop:16897 length:2673 start_codon:yes stop_codon:yes gene_type:complete
MAIFNPEFLTNPVASLNTAFGIPTCMLNLSMDALSFIDGDVLLTMTEAAEQGKAAARSAMAGVVNTLFSDMGLLSYDAGTGKFTLFSESSKFGIDLSFLEKLSQVNGFLLQLEEFIQEGTELYEEISGCLGQFEDWLNSTGPSPITGTGGLLADSSDQYTENARAAALGIARQRVDQTIEFAKKCNNLIENIGLVLIARQQEITTEASEGPIFRLVYGPPVSKQGLFILSEDGIYYDSQTRLYGGKPIPSASDIGFVVDSEKWTMDHAANLGGKGTLVSVDNLNEYVDTIFDPNKIDNSETLTNFYDADHFLNVLYGHQSKRVDDIRFEIIELQNSGYNDDSALLINHKQTLRAVTDSYEKQINKRKKQIEVAVKAPDLFGSTTAFELGTIPVNDFSYLSSISLGVTLEKQQELTFQAGDVDDVVLPVEPTFVTNYGTTSEVLISPLVVPPIGKGSILFSNSVSSTQAPALSLTDLIASNNLFSIYNFLKPSVYTASSLMFDTLNCATLGTYGDAQLVGRTTQGVFASGLGIPFLQGVARFESEHLKLVNVGSYLRLPPTNEFQNLLYSKAGCSLDCWVHIPYYGTDYTSQERGNAQFRPYAQGGWGDYGYYKILLGNENLGGALSVADPSSLVNARGTDSTRGLLLGFTRDPVIYRDDFVIPGPNTNPGLNVGVDTSSTTASSCFFIAPTQAFDNSSVEFVPNSSCANQDGLKYCKMTIKDDLSINGSRMSDVSSGFVHLHISFNVSSNNCSIYLDGNKMATSSMQDVFGSEPSRSPRIPTFITSPGKQNPSFQYTASTLNQRDDVSVFNNGPLTDTYFTPWIVGGGWTDGFPIDKTSKDGGFMGLRHGLTSGLNGFIGSVKFYSRPLTNKEVVQNYEAQKGFFKNIIT